ncbi:flagellar protein FliT [Ammoniphilus sp. CFH 90114]|uniref:flagellar protein FliT n=1 Tax=Ammoniphilus sp. CFH 90114 TaxID=2493665 RepID=UPI00100F0CD7|nr:flagellar protein FliT [Ammoniphilus sp. CFH 90114]RXT04453.1 flagellar protein FliT [Ammoniphilus sp. CFH 90114]
MVGSPFEGKKVCLEAFKEETQKQLTCLQAEDPEGFLESVERCEVILGEIEQFNKKPVILEAEEKKIKSLLAEILELRKEITRLIPPLQEKIRERLGAERKKMMIQQSYGMDERYQDSVFFDKKK